RGRHLPAPRADGDAPVVRRVDRPVALCAPVAGVALVQWRRHALVCGVRGRASAAPVVGLASRVRSALCAALGRRRGAAGASRAGHGRTEAVVTASWAIPWQCTLVLLYVVTLFGLLLYGSNAYVMVVAHRRHRREAGEGRPMPDPVPYVTVQLPLFNERYVAARLVRAVAVLDYPADRLEIQVLDDSTDDTAEIVASVVTEVRARGGQVAHCRRAVRTGFKAGALAEGLATARG